MYIIIAPRQIKEGFRERFVEEIIGDAEGSVNKEPGCLRFDVVQDPKDPNRIWLYEVYKDEAAFKEHTKTPHIKKWLETTKDWRDQGPSGAGRGSHTIWPPNEDYK